MKEVTTLDKIMATFTALCGEGRTINYLRLTGETQMAITKEDLQNWFTYHSPTPDQLPKYQAIREAGLTLATAIVDNTPASADQTAAVRKIREAVMTANQSIACGGK